MEENLIDEIKSILKKDCEKCNIRYKHENKTRCSDCMFTLTNYSACGIRFREFGLYKLKKTNLYFFLNNQEYNFKFPKLPCIDLKGNRRKNKKWFWIIHHKNKIQYDDSKENLKLMLNVDHDRMHTSENPPMRNPVFKKKFCDKMKNLGDKHHTKREDVRKKMRVPKPSIRGENSPTKRIEVREKISKSMIGNTSRNKEVVIEYKHFKSLKEASKETSLSYYKMNKNIQGKIPGFYFIEKEI